MPWVRLIVEGGFLVWFFFVRWLVVVADTSLYVISVTERPF